MLPCVPLLGWHHRAVAPSPSSPSPFAERVLDVVAAVPAGSVVTYGDVAEMLGEGGPRQVGHVLSRYGGGVPWHRVVRADGTPAPALAEEALRRLVAEGVPLRGADRAARDRVDLAAARWQPAL